MGKRRAGLEITGALSALTLTASCWFNAPDKEDAPSFGQSSQALTSEQVRVLGFEAPTADWSASAGQLGTSNEASEGSSALAVTPDGWTEVSSIPLDTLANVRDTLSYESTCPGCRAGVRRG